MSRDVMRIARRRFLALGAAVMMMAPGMAFAQAYPSKTITFVCAFAPGSGSDVLVRYFAEKVSKLAGVPVIVENKPGATGNIAAEYTARAQPDGHTIFVHSGNTVAGNMWILKNPPIDGTKDLHTIATTHKQAMVLTVRHDSPYQSLADLVADQKAKGDAGSYATNSTSGIVLAEEFKQLAGLQTVRVQYASSAESLNDMLAGHVDFGTHDPASALANMREGRYRILAIGASERMESLGDLPTFKEQGYNVDQLGWWGVMVSSAVPDDVVTKINGWFGEVLALEETKKFLANSGGEPFISTPAEAQKLMEDTVAEWKRLIEIAQIQQQ